MINEKSKSDILVDAALVAAIIIAFLLVVFGAARSGAEKPDNTTVIGPVGQELDRYMERIVPFGFSGALLVANDGKIILNKGYGMAVRSTGIRNTADTVLNTGSITKQFTAAGIMKLEMMGKLVSSDPITRFFKNVPADKTGITLHHLMTHSAGIVDAVGDDYVMAGRDETVQKILTEPLLFKPGEEFSYSNAGYSLLAAVIERVSGQDYESFLNEQLFKPAGMRFTGYRKPDWKKRTVAHWYVGEKDNGIPIEKPYPSWYVVGNGEILSTTMDLYRWHLALLGSKILSEKVKKKMFTPYLNDYGYGWDVLDEDHGRLIQHDGGSDLGSSAEFRRYIDRGLVTILFCNQGYNNTGRALFSVIRDKIEALAFGGNVSIPPETIQTPIASAGDISGLYKLKKSGGFYISVKNNRLYLEPRGQEAVNVLFFDSPGVSGTIAGLHSLSESAFDAVLTGNYKPLNETLWNSEKRAQRVRDYIEKRKKLFLNRTGKLITAAAVLTMPLPGGNQYKTTVRLTGEKDSIYFNLRYRDGLNAGVSPAAGPENLNMVLQPIKGKPNQYAAYHFPSSRTIRLSFKTGSNDTADRLTVLTGKQEVTALK